MQKGVLMTKNIPPEKTPDRLRNYIRHFAAKYPSAWQQFDYFRSLRGKELPDWPEWCWCPLAASYAIVSGGGDNRVPFERMADVGTLGALAAWRMTQGIYRFDTDLFAALWSTPLNRIPVEILYNLPEWCAYIEAPPGYQIDQYELLGWFTHLEWDAKAGRPELRFVFDFEKALSPFMLHLTAATLAECVDLALAESGRQAELLFEEPPLPSVISPEQLREVLTAGLEPIVSVVLYLCTLAADIADLRGKRERPGNPVPRKTKKGLRTFPLDGPTTWLTGYRIGATLRLAGSGGKGEGEGTEAEKASPRPHIRRAHWHTYLTGPRDRPQKPVLKWLPPVPVGAGEIVPVIRGVE